MKLAASARRRAAPAVIRYYQWRGDPLARLLRREVKDDPYPLYDEIRRRPLAAASLGAFMTADHAVAGQVLRDRRFSAAPARRRGYQPPACPGGDPRAGRPDISLLMMDPPDHTRIRRLVAGAFTPRAVAALEPLVARTAGRLLDAADDRAGSGFDLIGALALPLPIAVICHLLGVPARDQDRFRDWGHALAAALEPEAYLTAAAGPRAAELELTGYLQDLVAARRAEPDGSLLSALGRAGRDGDRLSHGELVAVALLLLVAGFETTVNLIGNGTVALLRHPGQWQRLAADPGLAGAAVEELLRYDSPVQVTSRTAAEDLELAGTPLRAGTLVVVALGGANRDPAVFASPGALEIGRPNAARHLSFSLGIHHCLGAALARLEGRIALAGLARRFPGLELAGPPARRPLLVLRGFESVPVRAPGRVRSRAAG